MKKHIYSEQKRMYLCSDENLLQTSTISCIEIPFWYHLIRWYLVCPFYKKINALQLINRQRKTTLNRFKSFIIEKIEFLRHFINTLSILWAHFSWFSNAFKVSLINGCQAIGSLQLYFNWPSFCINNAIVKGLQMTRWQFI